MAATASPPAYIPPPPPRRSFNASSTERAQFSSSSYSVPPSPKPASTSGWKGSLMDRSKGLGQKLYHTADKLNDKLGHGVNGLSEKVGSNAFWAVNGDFPQEIQKCASILRAFTVEGVEVAESASPAAGSSNGKEKKKSSKWKEQKKTLMRIPSRVIRDAQGLVIFTSMRSGIAPLGGAGGNGCIIARLPDGAWSPPSGIMPFNLSGGFMLGVDIYDAVLVLRTAKSVAAFSKMAKPTLGGELAVVAGPWGTGAAAESGVEMAPVLSYVKSRGLYAGVELVGQVFVNRWEENARFYNQLKIKPEDILRARVPMPHEAAPLLAAIRHAEGSSVPSITTQTVPVASADPFADSPGSLSSGDGPLNSEVEEKEALQARDNQERREMEGEAAQRNRGQLDPLEHDF